MTRFFVDNREITAPFELSSLEEVIKHVEAVHLPPESVVRQIRIDGLPLVIPDSGEKSELPFQVDQRDRIDIFTGTIAEIARDSIADALQYLGRIETATPSLITSFQVSPGPESFERLKQLYEGLYWLTLLLSKLEMKFQLNLAGALIRGTPASEHHKRFIAVLKQLIEGQQKGDFVLIADLLEYEILPLVRVWREMFGLVSEKVNTAQ